MAPSYQFPKKEFNRADSKIHKGNHSGFQKGLSVPVSKGILSFFKGSILFKKVLL